MASTVSADLVLALGVAALGVCLAVGGSGFSLGAGYDRIGPRFFPYLVALGLVLLGGWLALAAIRGSRAKPATGKTPPLDLRSTGRRSVTWAWLCCSTLCCWSAQDS